METYQFNGTITLNQLLRMEFDLNKKSLKDIGKPIIKFIFGKELSSINGRGKTLTIKSLNKEFGENLIDTDELLIDFDEDSNVTDITRFLGVNPQKILELIEFYSNVKIWKEEDLLCLKDTLGFFDEDFEDSLYTFKENLLKNDTPFSPSLGLQIISIGSDLYEDWDEKVGSDYEMTTLDVLFDHCNKTKLNEFISKFEDELDYVSKLESVINNNTSDYERYRIYDLIDPTNSHLSEKFMNCIDPNNFTPMSN